jgi:KWG Leptospira.
MDLSAELRRLILKTMTSNSSILPLIGLAAVLWSSCTTKRLATAIEIQPATLDYIGDRSCGWQRIRQDTRWGYIHTSSKRFITPRFDWGDDFHDGFAVVQRGGRAGFITSTGGRWGRLKYQRAGHFSDGVAPVKIRGKYGYLDARRKWVVRPRYDYALPFQEGRAVVADGLHYGFIDRTGNRVTRLEYEDATPFRNGLARVRKNGHFGLIDTHGVEVLPLVYTAIEPLAGGGYRLTGKDGVGLADANGRLLVNARYRRVQLRDDGNYSIENHSGKVGLFHLNQRRLILPVVFDAIYDAGEGIYLCHQNNNHYVYADSAGHLLYGLAFEDAGTFSEGLAAVKKDGKWGYIDTAGRLAIPFQFDAFDNRHYARMRFSSNRAWVRKGGMTALIDRSGHTVALTDYPSALPFTCNRALVVNQSGRIGYVDTLGAVRIPLMYTGGSAFNTYGIGWVTKSPYDIPSYHTINTAGEIIDSLGFQPPKIFNARYWYTDRPKRALLVDRRTGKITDYPYDNMYRSSYMPDDLFHATRDQLSGLIDTSMAVVIPLRYRTVETFHHNRARVVSDTGEGFVDRLAREILPLHYEKLSYFRYPVTVAIRHGRRGVLDTAGRVVIPLDYDAVDIDYANNRIIATDSLGARIFDRHGYLLNDRQYDRVSAFHANRATVRKNGKTGVVDYLFGELCPPIYDRIGPFKADGMARVVNDGKIGYLDSAYQVCIPIIYDDGDIFIHGMAKVKLNGEELFVDRAGKRIYPDEATIQAREAAIAETKEDMRWLDFSG